MAERSELFDFSDFQTADCFVMKQISVTRHESVAATSICILGDEKERIQVKEKLRFWGCPDCGSGSRFHCCNEINHPFVLPWLPAEIWERAAPCAVASQRMS